MRCKNRRQALVQLYRRYARSIGWNDHPTIAEQKVDLWLAGEAESVDAAIRWGTNVEGPSVMKAKTLLCVLCSFASFALLAAYSFVVGGEQQAHRLVDLRELCLSAFGSDAPWSVTALHTVFLCLIGLLLTEAVVLASSLLHYEPPATRYRIGDQTKSTARIDADPAEPWAWDRLR